MRWQLHEIMIPLFAGAVVMMVIVLVTLRRSKTPGALPLALLSLALSIYTLGYAGELGSRTVNDVLTWLKIEYIGVAFLRPFMFLTILDVSGGRRYFSPPNLLILFTIPVMTVALAWTAESHDWVWQNLELVRYGNLYFAQFSTGIWYQINVVYTIVLILASLFILVRAYRRATDGVYRRQLATIFIGVVLPFLVYAIYILDVLSVPLDLNPFGLTMGSMVMAWALFQQQLFDVAPVARETLLAGMRDGVIVADTKGRIVEMNQTARQALNVMHHEIAGHPLENVLAAWSDLVTKYQDVYDISDEITINLHDQPHTYDLQITPLRDHSDKLRGRLIILSDITARVRAENALKENYARIVALRDIDTNLAQKLDPTYVAEVTTQAAASLSGADVVVVMMAQGDDLRVLAANSPFLKATIGTKLAPAQQSSFNDAIQNRQLTTLTTDQLSDSVFLVNNMRAQVVGPLISGDKFIGLLVLEYAHINPLTERDTEMLRLLIARAAVAMDNAYVYEERSRLIAELEAFSHTVAHDLKTPLHAIIGYVGLLNEELSDTPASLELSQKIEKIAYSSLDIINHLLLLAKMRGTEDIELAALDMKSVVQNALSQLTALVANRQAEISTPESWPTAQGFAPWVEAIWVNYISNAIKYGGEPPVIKLGSHPLPNNMLCFWIEDNGKGLSENERAKLFQPFTRLSQTRIEGHGLGLSIVQRIAERLDGTVGVESTPGQGSRFYFTLPMLASEAPYTAAEL